MIINEWLDKAGKYVEEFYQWVVGLSERTLSLTAIAILYLTFLPDLVAYLNSITDSLPSLNSYVIVTASLAIMNMRAIFKKDQVACIVHMVGFISLQYTFAFILLK